MAAKQLIAGYHTFTEKAATMLAPVHVYSTLTMGRTIEVDFMGSVLDLSARFPAKLQWLATASQHHLYNTSACLFAYLVCQPRQRNSGACSACTQAV